jgi:hypothetical protein
MAAKRMWNGDKRRDFCFSMANTEKLCTGVFSCDSSLRSCLATTSAPYESAAKIGVDVANAKNFTYGTKLWQTLAPSLGPHTSKVIKLITAANPLKNANIAHRLDSHMQMIPPIPVIRLRIIRFYSKTKICVIRQFFTDQAEIVILPQKAVAVVFNPFDVITKPIGLVTKSSAAACNLLFLAFVLIPVSYYYGGPRFTVESFNCLTGVFWFAIPFLMVLFSFLTFSWWRFTSSLAFAGLWVPVSLLSFVVWMPLVEGAENNKNPFSECLETRKTGEYSDECRYRISARVLGPMGDRKTIETHLVPGLKWIKITDQQIYSVWAAKKILQ